MDIIYKTKIKLQNCQDLLARTKRPPAIAAKSARFLTKTIFLSDKLLMTYVKHYIMFDINTDFGCMVQIETFLESSADWLFMRGGPVHKKRTVYIK